MRDSTANADGADEHTKTIGEVSAIHEVSLRTLRFYESRGLLHPLRIGSHRLYCAKDETRLKVILKGKRLGFTLAEIEKIILSGLDRHPDAERLAPEQATKVALTPALVEKQIVKLTQTLDETNAAIAELKQRLPELEPA